MRSFPSRRRALLALVPLAALAVSAAPLAAATDGTYVGTVAGRPFQLTVSNNRVIAWSVQGPLQCPQFTINSVSISGVSCPIAANETFTCGGLGCPQNSRVQGSFGGNTVTGTFDLDLDPTGAAPCCSLRNLAFTATRQAVTVPAAPTGLTATALDQNRVRLEWNDNATNESEYLVEVSENGGPFVQLEPPLPGNSEGAVVTGLDPATDYTFRVRARNSAGASAYSNQASATTHTTPSICVPSDTVLCLNNDRFKVEAIWQTATASGVAHGVELTPDTGYLWFFSASNVEVVLKVLNACVAPFNHYWFFAGGLTDQRVVITVTDTQTGAIRRYTNPLGAPFQPIQDTQAFATCP